MHSHRHQHARNITLIGGFVNILQGTFKVCGGIWFHSHALIADGIHSYADLLSDFMVLFASYYGNQDADATHPYGHQRIETVGTFAVSILLLLAGIGIGWDAVLELLKSKPETPTSYALGLAFASLVVNELLFFATLKIGKQIHSSLIQANAWHHRSDSLSALVVLIGIIGSLLGYIYLDAIAAILVAFLIIKMGAEYTWQSLSELIDSAVNPELVESMQKIISSVPGVNKIHQLRTRSMGGFILVDVHILVFPYLSVSEGHYIAQQVHQNLKQQLSMIMDVTVHVDPEDDESVSPSFHLPNRHALERNCLIPLKEKFPMIQTWIIHYLMGQITIDLYLKNSNDLQLEKLRQTGNQITLEHQEIRMFRFYVQHE